MKRWSANDAVYLVDATDKSRKVFKGGGAFLGNGIYG